MKKYYILLAAAVLIAMFVVFLPADTVVETVPFDMSSPYYEQILAKIGDDVLSRAECENLYILHAVEQEKEGVAEIFFPLVTCTLDDVGKAGTSIWIFRLEATAFSWDGENLMPSRRIRMGETAFSLTADGNTVLYSDGSGFENSLEREIPASAWGEDISFTTSVLASTKESAFASEAVGEAAVKWEGSVMFRCGLFTRKVVPFSLSLIKPYRNNL